MSSEVGTKTDGLNELIAYCGVDCGVCPDYTGKACPCCRKTVWEKGDECLPVKCCREKQISCCGECDALPCPEMKEFYGESESHERALELMRAVESGDKHFKQ